MRVIVLIVAFAVSSAFAVEKFDASLDAWRGTDLDLNFAKTFITNEKCKSSEIYLRSCTAAIQAAAKKAKLAEALEASDDFEGALNLIVHDLPADIPAQFVLGAAINAHLNEFDSHAYIRPSSEPLTNIKTESVGIGFVMQKIAGRIHVVEVEPNSPALKAGINFGDVIVAINGQSPTESDIIDTIPHESGKNVTIDIEREGKAKSLGVAMGLIQRQIVEIDTIDASTGYIRIRKFVPGKTCSKVRESLDDFTRNGVQSIILDLRGNSGGSLYESLCVGSLFLGMRDLVGTKFIPVKIPESHLIHPFDQSTKISWMPGYNLFPKKVKLAVLVDAQSASGSEVVAGAVEYYQAGWLIGERTFGKGSVQTVEPITDHQSLTIAATTGRYFFPDMNSVQRVGLAPSFEEPLIRGKKLAETSREVDLFPNSLEAVNGTIFDSRAEQIAKLGQCANQDPRLEAAVAEDYQKAFAAAILRCEAP